MAGRGRVLAMVAAGALLLTGCPADDQEPTGEPTDDGAAEPQPAEPVSVVIGTAVERDAANVAFLMADEQGIYEECGLDAEVVHFAGGGALMPALTAGEVDFGWVGTTTVVQAIEEGAPLKTIAEVNRSVAGWGLMVPADSPIQSVEDIQAGAQISFTSEGALSHWFALYAAEQAGLSADDIVGVPLGGSVPAIRSAMETGDTDAAIVLLPWGQILEPDGFRWVMQFDEELPEFSFTGLHTNEQTLEDRETAARVVGAYARSVEWMTDNREETEAFIGDFYELDEALASEVYDLVIPDYNPTGEMDVERMQYLIDTVAEIPGFIEGTVTAEDVVDLVEPQC
ncbi:MAG TPA: ABC transporter substrate-binding protein [Egibacteraceae bacterium]|nr:ABC transporter substrate-binding protein [Egibacteraceae bacterium]